MPRRHPNFPRTHYVPGRLASCPPAVVNTATVFCVRGSSGFVTRDIDLFPRKFGPITSVAVGEIDTFSPARWLDAPVHYAARYGQMTNVNSAKPKNVLLCVDGGDGVDHTVVLQKEDLRDMVNFNPKRMRIHQGMYITPHAVCAIATKFEPTEQLSAVSGHDVMKRIRFLTQICKEESRNVPHLCPEGFENTYMISDLDVEADPELVYNRSDKFLVGFRRVSRVVKFNHKKLLSNLTQSDVSAAAARGEIYCGVKIHHEMRLYSRDGSPMEFHKFAQHMASRKFGFDWEAGDAYRARATELRAAHDRRVADARTRWEAENRPIHKPKIQLPKH